jgi:hypothetical protein
MKKFRLLTAINGMKPGQIVEMWDEGDIDEMKVRGWLEEIKPLDAKPEPVQQKPKAKK